MVHSSRTAEGSITSRHFSMRLDHEVSHILSVLKLYIIAMHRRVGRKPEWERGQENSDFVKYRVRLVQLSLVMMESLGYVRLFQCRPANKKGAIRIEA